MDDTVRKLRYEGGLIKFPCGVKIEVSEEKLKWIFDLFKLQKEFEKIISTQAVTIPKPKAFQIKSYLTKD